MFRYMQGAIDDMEPVTPEWDLLDNNFNVTFDAWFRQMGYPIVTVTSQSGVLRFKIFFRFHFN